MGTGILVGGMSRSAYYWQVTKRLENRLLDLIFPSIFTVRELAELQTIDQQFDDFIFPHDATAKDKVLGCVNYGLTNSSDIADVCGMPLHNVSSWLSVLYKKGEIARVKEYRFGNSGRFPWCYVPITSPELSEFRQTSFPNQPCTQAT